MKHRQILTAVFLTVLTTISWNAAAANIAARENPAKTISAATNKSGNPFINFTDGKILASDSVNLSAKGAISPLAAASADFDEDGTRDLAIAYKTANGGLISIRRGNVESIFPQNHESESAPFFKQTQFLNLPLAPDFLAAGDFNGDGKQDLLAAQIGASLLVFRAGTGNNDFSAPQLIKLVGTLTAFAVGEMNNFDDLPDVAVGIIEKDGAKILIFQSRNGAFADEPQNLKMSKTVSALCFGELDDKTPRDLAAAAGDELVFVSGNAGGKIKEKNISRRKVDFQIAALAIGDFVGERENEIAILSEGGGLKVLSPDFSQLLSTMQTPTEGGTQNLLLTAKVSTRTKTDLIIASNNQLHLVMSDGGADNLSLAATFDTAENPIAVLPMRLNKDALTDLVVLTENNTTPSVLMTAPMQILMVSSAADSGANTLRAAIETANNSPGLDEIRFDLSNPNTPITIQTDLPEISDATTLDATTQSGFTGEPVIEIGGDANGSFTVPLFRFTTEGNSVLRGFVAKTVGAELHIVRLEGDNNFVEGNFIGTNRAGTASSGAAFHAVQVSSSGNVIGGAVVQARNVISGANATVASEGVSIDGNNNRVEGNYIGTDKTGMLAVPNGGDGIGVGGEVGNVIGGAEEGKRNVISGNGLYGVSIVPSPGDFPNAVIENNFIGTNKNGDAAIGNGAGGIQLYFSAGNNPPTATVQILDNVISGNTGDGIYASNIPVPGELNAAPRGIISDGFILGRRNANLNASPVVATPGNRIGTNADGTAALPNTGNGVRLENFPSSLIEGNTISANGASGIRITNDTPLGNFIADNYIGTNSAGNAALGNANKGIWIEAAGSPTLETQTTKIYDNVISGNTGDGVFASGMMNSSRNVAPQGFISDGLILGRRPPQNLNGAVNGNNVVAPGNRIGTNADGTAALGNTGNGVSISGVQTKTDDNTIAYNGGNGVNLAAIQDQTVRPGNPILNNLIYSNAGLGIDLGGDGLTPNDLGDGDTGPNNLQNYPVVTSAASNGSQTFVSGTINTTPDTDLTIQFYATSDGATNFGGNPFGTLAITSDETGNASFTATFPVGVNVGRFVSATATTADTNIGNENNTSEISPGVMVFAPTSANVTVAGKILSPQGRGIARAIVSLTDFNGVMRTAISNPFGYYRFTAVTVGETYVFNVRAKGYQFLPRVVSVTEQMENLNFMAK